MHKIRRLIQILGWIMPFVIPIMQSAVANTIDPKQPKSFLLIFKNPLFWICLVIYIIYLIVDYIIEHKPGNKTNKTDTKESCEPNIEDNEPQVPSSQQGQPVDDYNAYEREIIRVEGQARLGIITETLESVKNKDFERVEDLVKIYRELDEIKNRRR